MIKTAYQKQIIRLTFLAGLLWMSFLLMTSKGTPLHDEIGHYLISRDALTTPEHIFDTWGRTVNTLLYILPAQLGLSFTRLFSLLLAFFTALLALKVSKLLQVKYFFLVPLFIWFQPWFCDLSYLCLTEVPFSLLMVLATYFYLRKHSIWASIIIGMLPLIRHEGIALTFLWTGYQLFKRDWRSAILAFSPLAVYNVTFYLFMETWPFTMYFSANPTNMYGKGAWYHFLIRLFHPRAAGIPIMMLVMCSYIPIIKSTEKSLIAIWYFSYFALHTVIFRFGLFASGGYKLFLLPLAPAIAITAVLGIEWVTPKIGYYLEKWTMTKGTLFKERNIIILVSIICLFSTFLFVKPHPFHREDVGIQKAAAWINANGLHSENIISTHVYFYHFLPKPVPPITLWEKFSPLSETPTGTIVIWDEHYSDRWDIDYTYLTSHSNEWKKIKEFEDGAVVIFRKNGI